MRQIVGYARCEAAAACAALAALYAPLRLSLNFFQPAMVWVEKQRHGAKVTKRYDQDKTPSSRKTSEVADLQNAQPLPKSGI